jgi:hypothetical protein
MSRKFSCIKENEDEIKCIYCYKLYSTKYNLKIHIKSCTKKELEDNKQTQIDELKKMLFEQQKKIEELSHVTETNNNNININENSHNTTNNTTNNINIYSIGKEDLSLLSKEDILKLCTSGTYYPIVAAEILHCNDKYPEYQNVLISNLRATTGQVKVNDKWITRSQDDILNTMMNTDKKHISSLIKDLEVDKKLHIKLESTQDEIDTNQVKEHQKSKIKQRLYDASDMIKKNKGKSVTPKSPTV